MATSAELYQLSWVIEQLLVDPRRLVQVRAQLHTGQQVQYLSWNDGEAAAGSRRRCTGTTLQSKIRPTARPSKCTTRRSTPSRPIRRLNAVRHRQRWSSPGRAHHRRFQAADFRAGNRVTFTDKNLQHRCWLDRARQPTHRHARLRWPAVAGRLRTASTPSSTFDPQAPSTGARRTITIQSSAMLADPHRMARSHRSSAIDCSARACNETSRAAPSITSDYR